MAPSAIPMEGHLNSAPLMKGTTTTALTNSGINSNMLKNAPSVVKSIPIASPPELDASKLRITLNQEPKYVPHPSEPCVAEQKTCTDHMLTASWTQAGGWAAPELKPYGPLSLMPTASVLHYATECFEGMKLYRGFDGKLRLFRPQLNCSRMLMSSSRVALPGFNPRELLKLITKLCAVDGPRWLPRDRQGYFLYIRPTMIADDSALGIRKPRSALLFVVMTMFPAMDANPRGMRLLASRDNMIRAWPGGFGYAKVGANYGPSLVAQGEAHAQGYDQILWLLGPDCEVTEAGASNFFIVWRTPHGRVQLVTAPLSDRIILDGVTRRSVLELARARLAGEGLARLATGTGLDYSAAPLEVVERKFGMDEVVAAAREGRLLEAFAAGTAFFIAPISLIHFRGQDLHVPLREGGVTGAVKGWMRGIMYGKERHEWGYVVDEDDVVEHEDEEERTPPATPETDDEVFLG